MPLSIRNCCLWLFAGLLTNSNAQTLATPMGEARVENAEANVYGLVQPRNTRARKKNHLGVSKALVELHRKVSGTSGIDY